MSVETPVTPQPTAQAPAAEEPSRRRRWFDDSVVYCLKVFVALRAGLWLIGVLAVGLLTPNAGVGPAVTPGWHNLFTAWNRWDVDWFMKIASHGYAPSNGTAAFFPLYPGLVHALGIVLGRHWLVAAYLLSNACFVAAMIIVYRLTAFESSEYVARRTVLYMAIFPTAFFFLAPYSESLFLLLTVSSFYAARKRHWLAAGLFGMFAALTRSIGVALALPLAVEALQQSGMFGRTDERRSIAQTTGALAASALPAAGLASYLGYWKLQAGNWLVPFQAQAGWSRTFSWPWDTLVNGTKVGLQFIGAFPGGYHTVDLVLMIVALAATIWVCVRQRPIYWIYTVASIVIPLFLVFGGRPFMSLPRFMLPIWPLFWAIAAFADRFKANQLVIAASAAGLGILGLLFVNSYWVF